MTQESIAALLSSTDPQAALLTHFAYLADSPGYPAVLKAVMQQATGVSMEGDTLKVAFGDERALYATAPAENAYAHWPDSFQRLTEHHGVLLFPDDDSWNLRLGEGDVDAEPALFDTHAAEVLCPVTDYSDWVIYHPTAINPQGQAAICFFSHESEELDLPMAHNPGSYFLWRMAEILELEIHRPVILDISDEALEDWYQALPGNWQKIILQQSEQNSLPELDRIKTVLDGHALRLRSERLDDFGPLSAFKKLRILEFNDCEISSLRSLPKLQHLTQLEIEGCRLKKIDVEHMYERVETLRLNDNQLQSLAGITSFPAVAELDLAGNQLSDIGELGRLAGLENLSLERNPIEDIAVLEQLTSLSRINLAHTKVKDIASLRGLDNLSSVKLSGTDVADISAIFQKSLRSLFIKDTPVPFRQILALEHQVYRTTERKLKAGRWKKIKLYTDFTRSAAHFIDAVKSLGQSSLSEAEYEFFILWVDGILRDLLGKDMGAARKLLHACLDVEPQTLPDSLYESFIIPCIITIIGCDDSDLVRKTLDSVRRPVANHLIAFNLACLYSRAKDKPRLIEYTRLALELGHEVDEFISDSDFAPFHEDEDFLAMIT